MPEKLKSLRESFNESIAEMFPNERPTDAHLAELEDAYTEGCVSALLKFAARFDPDWAEALVIPSNLEAIDDEIETVVPELIARLAKQNG